MNALARLNVELKFGTFLSLACVLKLVCGARVIGALKALDVRYLCHNIRLIFICVFGAAL